MTDGGNWGASFEFATATRIVFGPGKLDEVVHFARRQAMQRVVFVTGRRSQPSVGLRHALGELGLRVSTVSVSGEPTVEHVRDWLADLSGTTYDAIIGMGGGSALDAAKALAALLANGGDPLDYLEVVGRGQALTKPSVPVVAVPTTAGTGAEVTRNAVLGSERDRVKASLRSPHMLPCLAVVDPDLLSATPTSVLRASGIDALSQLIEPFLSARANPFSDALAREGIVRSARSLRRAVLTDLDGGAREDLALASLFGGICLANAGLGAVHGFAGPIGGTFDAPHGAVCAALLPHVLDVNLRALTERAPSHPARMRYFALGQMLTGDARATEVDCIGWVRELCAALEVPGLSHYGVQGRDVPALVQKAKAASSMRGNPLPLMDEELTEIATLALEPIQT